MATVEMGQFLVNYSGIKAGEIFLEPTVYGCRLA